MPVKSVPITSSANRAKSGAHTPRIAGALGYLVATYQSAFDYSFFLRAAISSSDWADVERITKAELVLVTPAGAANAISGIGAPKESGYTLYLLAENFPDNASTSFLADPDGSPTRSTASPVLGAIQPPVGYENKENITNFICGIAPKTVKQPNGSPCLAHTNYGYHLVRRKTNSIPDPTIIVASERHPDTFVQPRIDITYVAKAAPGQTILSGPPSVIPQIEGHSFEGDLLPSRAQDSIEYIAIQVYPAAVLATAYDDAGSKATWHPSPIPASATASETNHFSVPIPELLKSAASYKWRARIRSNRTDRVEWTPWTAAIPLTITTDSPVLETAEPVGVYPTLNGVYFKARYSDPNGDPIRSYRIQVRDQTAPSDPDWDDGPFYWDTSDHPATATERAWRMGASSGRSVNPPNE